MGAFESKSLSFGALTLSCQWSHTRQIMVRPMGKIIFRSNQVFPTEVRRKNCHIQKLKKFTHFFKK